MSTIYDVFNTRNEEEFSGFLNTLDLSPNDLLNVVSIAESYLLSKDEKQKKLLEYVAGTTDRNYDKCFKQFKKGFKRVLKEDTLPEASDLSLNQIMELNQLIELVAGKLSTSNCMGGLYNIISAKTNQNIAKAFLGMAQQSEVNDSSLKFNTDLVINGQNVAQAIYPLKAEIEMFLNNLSKEEKQAEKSVTEAEEPSFSLISELTKHIDSSNIIEDLQQLVSRIDDLIKTYKDTNIQNSLSALKSSALTKIAKLDNAQPEIEECCTAGATCASCVAAIPSVMPKASKKRKKKMTEDVKLFKECVENDFPSSLTINDRLVSFKIIEGKSYLYVDNGILGTTNKKEILEAIEDLYNNCLQTPIYEDMNHVELDLLLEDMIVNDTDNNNEVDPIEMKKKEDNVKNAFSANSSMKVNVEDPKDDTKSLSDQEMVGIDDSDENNKKYIVKDPSSGKVTVVPIQSISLQGDKL